MQHVVQSPFFTIRVQDTGQKTSFVCFLEVKKEIAPQPFENSFGLFLIGSNTRLGLLNCSSIWFLFSIHIYKYDVLKIFMKDIPVTSLTFVF